MAEPGTKQRILLCALNLFSQFGYEAVSVDQIAKAVGVKAPSLYKHYKSKRDIFDAIFEEMQRRYDGQVASMRMHLTDADADAGLFDGITEDALVSMVKNLVLYSLHDEYVSKFRKLLTIEQFRERAFAELYTERYVNSMLDYHEQLFTRLIAQGVLKAEDPRIMALQYVSPVCVLLSLCDRQPGMEAYAMELVERHIRQFNRIYGKKE